jgi:hypothetical protein
MHFAIIRSSKCLSTLYKTNDVPCQILYRVENLYVGKVLLLPVVLQPAVGFGL